MLQCRGMAGVWQGYGRGMAGVWQGYGRGMPGVWQGYGRGIPRVWQGYGRGMAGVYQGYGRGMPHLLLASLISFTCYTFPKAFNLHTFPKAFNLHLDPLSFAVKKKRPRIFDSVYFFYNCPHSYLAHIWYKNSAIYRNSVTKVTSTYIHTYT